MKNRERNEGMSQREELLVEYLRVACPGRRMTVQGDELEAAMQLSANELRRKINRLRRKGVPIGSSRYGYFYAVTAGEVYATIRRLRTMVRGLEAAIQGLEESLEHFGELDGPGGDPP